MIISSKGDSMARLIARLCEIEESVKIILQACDKYEVAEGVEKKTMCPVTESYVEGRIEAPRGEDFHYGKIKDARIQRYRIRTPTFSNITLYSKLLIGSDITDVPVIIQSMDPCFSCMDRLLLVKKNKREILTGKEFRHKYCGHHD